LVLHISREGGVGEASWSAAEVCLWLQPPCLCFLAAIGLCVLVCGEVKAMLVFNLVSVAEASVRLEGLSVVSLNASARSDHLSLVEEVFLAHVLCLLLSSFFFASGG
jgi:hypothetical protein